MDMQPTESTGGRRKRGRKGLSKTRLGGSRRRKGSSKSRTTRRRKNVLAGIMGGKKRRSVKRVKRT